ncbi:T9SS type A sorting domain-containing protein [uncultured Dokdonia sp.]|uniref:T9SS type A sorting domain-containing protein n=1 Tax=uncultured Dokdonia sp. TaxID=575653 RepID=UPI002634C0DB|nr:T9SS type A sorting domain-containing protein [uncultured Dokdonia sp.]
MKKYYLYIIVLLWGIFTMQAQTITLDIGCVQGDVGDVVLVPVTASSSPGITNLLTMQGTIKFSNTTGLSFLNLTSSEYTMMSGFFSEISNGVITFSINDPSFLMIIDTNTTLFEIEVEVLEEGCTDISINDDVTVVEFVDTTVNEIENVDYTNTGKVCTDCIPTPEVITANNDDITNSLTYTLPCYQNTVAITTTNLTNVSYFSPELGSSSTGIYTLPSNNILQSFSIEITGKDSCGDDYLETVIVTVESLIPTVITANGDDITDSLVYTLACNEDTVDLSTTHLTNVFYSSPELGDSNTGNYIIPADSNLDTFLVYITGVDTCGDFFEEKIEIQTGASASYITNVELLNGGYSNPTGSSPGNYGDYTNTCIPYFDSSTGLINVTTTAADLFMSVYVDSVFLFNTFTNNGGTLINLQGVNIVGGEVIRIIVSENPITDLNDIPTCGEVEDYILCLPAEECALDALTSISSCSDNGTPLDPTDDFYNITLDVFNTQGQPWTVVNSNGLTIYFGYGDENNVDLGNYFVLNGSEGFQIRYGDNCFFDFGVVAPTSCNFSCNISAQVATGDCNDNGTPLDPSDDYYFMTVDVLGTNGVSWDLVGYAGSQQISYSGTGNVTNIQLGPINANDPSWVMYISPTGLTDPNCRRYETTIFAPKCSNESDRPKDRVSITPNPNQGMMDVEVAIHNDSVIELDIYRMNGTLVKTIKNGKTNKGILNFGLEVDLPSGLYLFSFKTNEGIITKRVIIDRK